MRLHAEVPVIALFGLMHLRGAYFGLVLHRGRGHDQRGIDNRPSMQNQSLFSQMDVDRLRDLAREPIRFKQPSEFPQGGRIARRLPRKIDPHKAPDHPAVVPLVLHPFVEEA